ncbi:ABC transporter ATP-binding protein [Leuconostoc pseudomesenteroides]|uniref:ABC transporter ATP-binding protein n=1 Tax=Leuconostoc pseudomesenteroides TaxID=33968 RepID=UPI00228639F5|nr:ABC transporter ATP-binding protein [Leuconostoc pseudomesenteroides]WAM38547.1 ABC transporter ATP-binding protein [Leuconostoc pseudomesenteroides]
MLRIQELHKQFNNKLVLNNVELTAKNGQVTALIGANGAGKSTLIGCVCGYFQPTKGSIDVRSISVMPDADNIYGDMTGLEFLHVMAKIKKVPNQQWNTLITRLGLESQMNKKIKTYSFGMKKKITFIQACIGDFDTYIFDEPTSGVDVESATVMMTIISEICSKGAAVLLTSHNLEELEQVSDYVYFLKNGVIESEGTVNDLLTKQDDQKKQPYVVVPLDMAELTHYLNNHYHDDYSRYDSHIAVYVDDCVQGSALLKELVQNDIDIVAFYQRQSNLKETLFGSEVDETLDIKQS